MKYFIYQGNNYDCGYASLKMLLAHLAKDKSYLFIKKEKKKDKFTLTDLVNIAESYGVKLEAYECDRDCYDKIKPLTITVIDQNHSVLIKKVRKKRIIIYDPGVGRVSFKKKDFLKRWSNYVLEVESCENIKKIGKIRQKVLPLKLKIIQIFCALISSAALVTTFYLLNDSKNALFSLLFLGLFAVSQIIENIVSYRQIYHFDKTFIKRFFSNKENCNQNGYENFIAFKKNYFSKNRTFLSSILVAVLLSFLLCWNDFRNLFVILALVLLKFLDIYLFSRSDEKAKKEIANFENEFMQKPTKAIEYAEKANYRANDKVLENSMKSIFYMVCCFAFSLLMMFVTKNSGCNFVIFHFVMYFVSYNSFSSVIENFSSKKEFEKNKQRFFETCDF